MSNLPVSWINVQLGDVVDYGNTSKAEPREITEDSWILELEDIEKISSKLIQRILFSERQSKSTKNKFEKNDVLYGKLRPYLDKVIIANESGYCTTEIIPIKPGKYLDNRFLFYGLKRKEFIDYVSEVSHGLNMPRLGTRQGQAAPFVLAPLNEQIRIADKLDSVLAKVDAAQARLEKIPTLLKRFRQSVLTAATSGELTREWRGENKLANWEEISLEELIETTANGLSKRNGSRGADIIILRLADFKDAKRVYGNERKIKLDEKEVEKYSLKSGDILVIRVNGSVDLAGKFIEYQATTDIEGFCDHFIRIRLNNQRILPTYLKFVANEGNGRDFLKSNLSTSAGQNTINQGSVKGLIVPLPTINEQKEIVRRVESLFTLADTVEKQYLAAKKRIDRLTQSLLAKAFRGELVPQDPNDEPAAELLKRIQAERNAQPPVKNKRKQQA